MKPENLQRQNVQSRQNQLFPRFRQVFRLFVVRRHHHFREQRLEFELALLRLLSFRILIVLLVEKWSGFPNRFILWVNSRNASLAFKFFREISRSMDSLSAVSLAVAALVNV